MTHCLKTWPEFYKAIESGEKTFEVRKNDRKYKPGDALLLQEYDPTKEEYTGKEWHGHITYMIYDDFPALKKGFCVFGIKEKDPS
jgi:hypothetical protein